MILLEALDDRCLPCKPPEQRFETRNIYLSIDDVHVSANNNICEQR